MEVKEDGLQATPVNNVGGGYVQGTGVGPQGEPGVKKRKRGPIMGMVGRKLKTFKEFTNAPRARSA